MSKQYLYRAEILRKKDNHPLDSIAYYSGEDQFDINSSKRYTSNTNEKVVWNNIIVPKKELNFEKYFDLPEYLKFRNKKTDMVSNSRNVLWKNIDAREIRADSQFARLFELAIPHFLNQEEAIQLVSNYADILVSEGMIADCSLHSHNKKSPALSLLESLKIIHNKEAEVNTVEHNQDYTAFLMCTLRDYKGGQFINKNRTWNDKIKLFKWRDEFVNLLETAIFNCAAPEEEKKTWLAKIEKLNDSVQRNQVMKFGA